MCVASCPYNVEDNCSVIGNTIPNDALCRTGQNDVEHFIETTGERNHESDKTLFEFGLRTRTIPNRHRSNNAMRR